jgi:hypothetical protein
VFKDFQPNHLAYWDRHLADNGNLQVVIMDGKGNVKQSLDLFTLLDLEENQRNNILMDGFSVDREGSVLFTLPVLFSAFRVSLGGNVASFGKPGSLPGKFGVVSGIIADNRGNYLVADKLRTVISVFDNDFNFLTEFGFRGNAPGNLIGPMDLAIDGNDSVYVVQAGKGYFKVHYAEQRISAGKGWRRTTNRDRNKTKTAVSGTESEGSTRVSALPHNRSRKVNPSQGGDTKPMGPMIGWPGCRSKL